MARCAGATPAGPAARSSAPHRRVARSARKPRPRLEARRTPAPRRCLHPGAGCSRGGEGSSTEDSAETPPGLRRTHENMHKPGRCGASADDSGLEPVRAPSSPLQSRPIRSSAASQAMSRHCFIAHSAGCTGAFVTVLHMAPVAGTMRSEEFRRFVGKSGRALHRRLLASTCGA